MRRWLPSLSLALLSLASAASGQELGAKISKNGTNVTGVTFRVWAPNAVAVHVAGDFNGWNESAAKLTRDPATNVWTATVSSARPGHAYKYIISTTSGGTLRRKDPRAREVRTMGDGSQAAVIYDKDAFVWEDEGFQPPFPNQIVMYELHVGTFYDPRPDDGEPATFYDAAQKLDYLRDLGVNMIALMPVSEFNGRHSWGYNPIALFAIEQAYGGPDGFKHFVNEAHKRGIAVQVDVVHNHYGDLAAPGASDLENFDGGNPYFYHGTDEVARPGIGRTKWGPRPRYSDPEVRRFIKENIKMYLDEYKVWALRWDSPRNITGFDSNPGSEVGDPDTDIEEAITMMQDINSEIHARNERYYSIAEDANSVGGYSGHWEISFHNVLFPRLLPLDTDGSLPAPFEGKLRYPTLNQRETDNIGYRLVTKEPPGFRVIFSENHDKCGDLNALTDGARLAEDFDPIDPTSYLARKKSILASAVTLTSAGTPMLFQGQEQLSDGFFDAYVHLDWLRASSFPEIVRFHRDATRLRRNATGVSAALQATVLPDKSDDGTGATRITVANEAQGWMVYERRAGTASQSIMVAVNFSDQTRNVSFNFPVAGPWYVLLNSDAQIYGADFGNIGPAVGAAVTASGGANTGTFQIGPFSAIVLGKTAGTAPSADANANGIDDGWEILFGASDAAGDIDGDGFSNLDEFLKGTDPTVADRAALAGSFNDWNTETRNARWDPSRSVWRYVARFSVPGLQTVKANLSDGWVAGGNHSFDVPAAGAYEITYAPASGTYSSSRVDADANGNGMADVWERFQFYPSASTVASANPDGDAFDNLAEFQRGSDPTEFDYPAMSVVGAYNGWNWSARNMRYSGHGVWRLALPFLQPPSGPNYKFGVGPTKDDENWGQPTVEKPDGFKSNVDFLWSAGLSGWHLVSFNEKNFSSSVVPVAGGADRDNDSMPDSWENSFGLDPFVDDRNLDADGDQVWNKFEYARGTSPRDATDHYMAVAVPGDWLPFAPRSGWLNNADPRLRMVWRPEINRWEQLRFVPRPVNLVVRAANHPFGSGDWAGTPGNQLLSFPDRGYYLVRFEEASKAFDPPFRMPTGDADLDGLSDYWESYFGQANPTHDSDGDGAAALAEFSRGSDPDTPDRSSNMHVVGNVSGWSFSSMPMLWNSARGVWQRLVFTSRLQESPQRAKFVYVLNAVDGWNNPNWGDGYDSPQQAPDGWADVNGKDIAYLVPSLPMYVLFEFEEIWGNHRAGIIAATDGDADGLADDWANYYGVSGALADPDGDGRPNIKEFRLAMDPRQNDGPSLATRNPSISLAGSFVNGWNEAGARMTLVDDFLWMIDWQVSSPNAQAFKFNVGNWSTQWGEMVKNTATGRAGASEDIGLPNLGSGAYRFSFNEATFEYTVTRLGTYLNRYGSISPNQQRPVTGLRALNEYLFGGTASVPPSASHLPRESLINGRLRLDFVARIDDAKLSHVVETSTDLSRGWTINDVVLISAETPDFKSGLMRYIYEAPNGGHSRQFLRVRSSLQP
jgi:1,4-alpha-glucan branching enzyme